MCSSDTLTWKSWQVFSSFVANIYLRFSEIQLSEVSMRIIRNTGRNQSYGTNWRWRTDKRICYIMFPWRPVAVFTVFSCHGCKLGQQRGESAVFPQFYSQGTQLTFYLLLIWISYTDSVPISYLPSSNFRKGKWSVPFVFGLFGHEGFWKTLENFIAILLKIPFKNGIGCITHTARKLTFSSISFRLRILASHCCNFCKTKLQLINIQFQ